MTNHRNRKRRQNSELTPAQKRKYAQEYQKRRDALMEQTLLGMDDGTFEAALNESVDFEKYMGLIDEEIEEQKRMQNVFEQEEPAALRMQKRHRERLPGLKISYK